MNLGQALVLVLSFPVLGILLAALTILEQRVLGGPSPSPGDRASAGEPGQPPAAFPGHPGRDPDDARGPQPPAAHQPGMASPGQELPPVAGSVPRASQARPPHPRSGQSVPGHTAAARAAPAAAAGAARLRHPGGPRRQHLAAALAQAGHHLRHPRATATSSRPLSGSRASPWRRLRRKRRPGDWAYHRTRARPATGGPARMVAEEARSGSAERMDTAVPRELAEPPGGFGWGCNRAAPAARPP
jgi:hypothetical protein